MCCLFLLNGYLRVLISVRRIKILMGQHQSSLLHFYTVKVFVNIVEAAKKLFYSKMHAALQKYRFADTVQ